MRSLLTIEFIGVDPTSFCLRLIAVSCWIFFERTPSQMTESKKIEKFFPIKASIRFGMCHNCTALMISNVNLLFTPSEECVVREVQFVWRQPDATASILMQLTRIQMYSWRNRLLVLPFSTPFKRAQKIRLQHFVFLNFRLKLAASRGSFQSFSALSLFYFLWNERLCPAANQ